MLHSELTLCISDESIFEKRCVCWQTWFLFHIILSGYSGSRPLSSIYDLACHLALGTMWLFIRYKIIKTMTNWNVHIWNIIQRHEFCHITILSCYNTIPMSVIWYYNCLRADAFFIVLFHYFISIFAKSDNELIAFNMLVHFNRLS